MNKIISSHISVINAVNIRSRFNKKNESIVIRKSKRLYLSHLNYFIDFKPIDDICISPNLST